VLIDKCPSAVRDEGVQEYSVPLFFIRRRFNHVASRRNVRLGYIAMNLKSCCFCNENYCFSLRHIEFVLVWSVDETRRRLSTYNDRDFMEVMNLTSSGVFLMRVT
jgi:hypothetical protein